MNGWFIIDKPLGLSSAQVVGAVKRILRTSGYAKCKIGHGGTLDPLATGVLPIALGEATKLTGRMLDADKAYAFTVRWGVATSSDDAEGQVIATSDVRPDAAAIRAALPQFTGPIRQRPPIYSALKIDGQRAYALARAGEVPEMAERAVTIHGWEIRAISADSATFAISCSKGTYIRALARDLAQALGTVGHVAMLRREKAGAFSLKSAILLDKLEALGQCRALEQALYPLMTGLDDIPALAVTPEQARALQQGRCLPGHPAKSGLHVATAGSVPVALVLVSAQEIRVERGFNLLQEKDDVGNC